MISYNNLIAFVREWYPRRHYKRILAKGTVINVNCYWVKRAIRDMNAFKRYPNPVTIQNLHITWECIEGILHNTK